MSSAVLGIFKQTEFSWKNIVGNRNIFKENYLQILIRKWKYWWWWCLINEFNQTTINNNKQNIIMMNFIIIRRYLSSSILKFEIRVIKTQFARWNCFYFYFYHIFCLYFCIHFIPDALSANLFQFYVQTILASLWSIHN